MLKFQYLSIKIKTKYFLIIHLINTQPKNIRRVNLGRNFEQKKPVSAEDKDKDTDKLVRIQFDVEYLTLLPVISLKYEVK